MIEIISIFFLKKIVHSTKIYLYLARKYVNIFKYNIFYVVCRLTEWFCSKKKCALPCTWLCKKYILYFYYIPVRCYFLILLEQYYRQQTTQLDDNRHGTCGSTRATKPGFGP